MAKILRALARELATRPASTWWRRSAPACMSRAATRAALEAAIAPYRDRGPGLFGSAASASLEDVFIDLMGRARDNFQ